MLSKLHVMYGGTEYPNRGCTNTGASYFLLYLKNYTKLNLCAERHQTHQEGYQFITRNSCLKRNQAEKCQTFTNYSALF